MKAIDYNLTKRIQQIWEDAIVVYFEDEDGRCVHALLRDGVDTRDERVLDLGEDPDTALDLLGAPKPAGASIEAVA